MIYSFSNFHFLCLVTSLKFDLMPYITYVCCFLCSLCTLNSHGLIQINTATKPDQSRPRNRISRESQVVCAVQTSLFHSTSFSNRKNETKITKLNKPNHRLLFTKPNHRTGDKRREEESFYQPSSSFRIPSNPKGD